MTSSEIDPSGYLPPHPDDGHAAAVNAAIRSGQWTPTLIGVSCDDCGDIFEADYLIAVGADQNERFEVARDYLRTRHGWLCANDQDLCPSCRAEQVKAARDYMNALRDRGQRR